MNILIVEDENTKYNDISNVINCKYSAKIERAINTNEALGMLRKQTYDFMLLDMTLPFSKDNRKLNTHAGKELLFDMQTEDIIVPTVVITRYSNFGTDYLHSQLSKSLTYLINEDFGKERIYQFKCYDITNFEGLHNYLKNEISFYLGIVFFTQQNDSWKDNIVNIIERIK